MIPTAETETWPTGWGRLAWSNLTRLSCLSPQPCFLQPDLCALGTRQVLTTQGLELVRQLLLQGHGEESISAKTRESWKEELNSLSSGRRRMGKGRLNRLPLPLTALPKRITVGD